MESNITSTGAQVVLAVIPIVAIVIGGVIIFFYLLWHHHEIKLQIKAGNYKPSKFDIKTFSLLAGLLLTGTGFILTLFFVLMEGFSYTLLGGLIPLILGIGMLAFYKVNPDFKDNNAN